MSYLDNVKGLLLDLEGVLYIGEKIIKGSVETVKKLLASNFKIKYLTNTTTVSRNSILKKLKKFNLPSAEFDIFSPPLAANKFLNQKKISRIYLLTNKSLHQDFKNFTVDINNPEAVVMGDIYKDFNWEKLNKAFQIISKNDNVIENINLNLDSITQFYLNHSNMCYNQCN